MRRVRGGGLGLILVGAFAPGVWGAEATIGLASGQIEISRLGPGTESGSVVFPAEQADQLRIEITSSLSDLVTSVEGPSGEIVNESTIGSFGGEFAFVSGETPGSPLVLPGLLPGYHYIFSFPSLGPGNYTVRFAAPAVLTGDAAVITELHTDSPVVATLFATEPVLPVGSSSVLTAALFEEVTPIHNATVLVSVKPPTGNQFTLNLQDDGLNADRLAGDGLYTGLFPVTEPGDYAAVALITGVNSHGTTFTRTTATRVTAVPGGALLTGALSDLGVDDNANTLFDRVVLSAGVEVALAGSYRLQAILTTAGGKNLIGYGQADLPTGPGTVTADFLAEDFLKAGEDGPYTITDVDLLREDSSTGLQPNDGIDGGTQLTRPYLLSDFERPAVELTGANSDAAPDTDEDGDSDQLEVRLGIRVRVPGVYQYLARLNDPCGHEIQSISGQQSFPSGAIPEALVLAFDGHLIGARGVSGAYAIVDFSISGPGGALTPPGAAGTGIISAQQFDGYQAAPDCDGDGTPDRCEINAVGGDDCNRNATPDDCDIASGASGDCNSNSLPDECEPSGVYPPASLGQDACGGAQFIGPGAVYAGSNLAATNDGSTSCDGGSPGADLWYRYRPVQSGTLSVSLCESGFDTVVSIHTACPGTPANEVACNDDACARKSEVTASVEAGVVYFIRVAGFSTRRGYFTMTLAGPACNTNDCNLNGHPDACDLLAGTGFDCNGNQSLDECDIASGTSLDCNANGVPDDCEGGPGLDCNANGTPDDCDIAAGRSLDCNANGLPDECDLAGGASRDCNLNQRPDECDIGSGGSADCDGEGTPDECQNGSPPPPSTAQDQCGRAQPVCPGQVYAGTTAPATHDGVAGCGSSEEAPDVWYRYVPARDGTLVVSLCGSSFDTVLSVHSGCPGGEENELACVDDACDLQSEVSLAVVAGTPYLIRVSGYSGDTGDFTLSLTGPECRLTDCNANGILDSCDLRGWAGRDCNASGVLDECEIASGASGDCDANGVPDECLGSATIATAALPGGSVALSWGAMPAATAYDVVRGSLQALASSGGDFGVATQACVADNRPESSHEDAGVPLRGEGFWYLVRGVNCALAGTYDSGSPSQSGSRDAEIQAAAEHCP